MLSEPWVLVPLAETRTLLYCDSCAVADFDVVFVVVGSRYRFHPARSVDGGVRTTYDEVLRRR